MKVLIIGSGIGGLSLANALTEHGLEFSIAERSPNFGEVGAGLSIWPNASKILDHWGLLRRLVEPGVLESDYADICSSSGELLIRSDLAALKAEIGYGTYIFRRPDLHSALASKIPPEKIHLGHELVGILEKNGKIVGRFANGREMEADLLVGADGISSAVRTLTFGPRELRYGGQTCYRGLARFEKPFPHIFREIQGPGRRVGLHSITEKEVYWWAGVNMPPHQTQTAEERRERMLREFREFPPEVTLAVQNTGEILKNDLFDIGYPDSWSKPGITLLGDAAHAMVPNLGQGACTAIEDGFLLGKCLGRFEPARAVAIYERVRKSRAYHLSKRSWAWGELARWESPLAVKLRESLWRYIPSYFFTRELRAQAIYDADRVSLE